VNDEERLARQRGQLTNPLPDPQHNHITRDIKPPGGGCPACDAYHARYPAPWEALPKDREWETLSVAEQRDELLAAVGLLVEFVTVRRPAQAMAMAQHPLMEQAVVEMGKRYGPWTR